MKRILFALSAFFLVIASPIAAGADTQLSWERSQMQQVEIDPAIAEKISEVNLIGKSQTLRFSPANQTSEGRQVFQVLIPAAFELGIYEVRAVMTDGTFKDLAAIRIVEYQSESYTPLTDVQTVTVLSITLFTLLAAWGVQDEPVRRDQEFNDDQTTYDGVDGGDIGRATAASRDFRRGLISSTYLDHLRSVWVITTNRVSPLLSRIISDGGYLQYSLGSLSLVFPLAGAILGALAFNDIQGVGIITTPSLSISLAIIILGSLDAAAGLAAVVVFGATALSSQAFNSAYDFRTFLGLAVLWITPSFIANATRSLRKSRKDSDPWERLTDLVVGSMITGWAVRSLVLALDGFAHLRLPLTQHADLIGYVAVGVIAFRYLIEGHVNNKNPYYLAFLSPKHLNDQSSYYRLMNWFFKGLLYLFFVVSFLGTTWHIWAALAILMTPTVLKVVKDKFPNSSALFQVLPVGIPAMVIMTLFGKFFSSYLDSLELDPATASRTIFILAALPGLTLGLLKMFGRQPKPGDVRWYRRPNSTAIYRIGGVALLACHAALTLGIVG